jgi:serine/threonine protein kinase
MSTGKTLEAGTSTYNVGQTIGNGASCKVKYGEVEGAISALKLLKDKMEDGSDTWELCKNEIEVMKILDHPNVVK